MLQFLTLLFFDTVEYTFQITEFFKYKLKSINLNTAQMQKVFKKLLLIIGLIAIFASVVQQYFDTHGSDFPGNGQATVVQFDKDNNRDTGDAAAITTVIYNQFYKKSTVYHFYSASYQEPTLLVHLRPPNA